MQAHLTILDPPAKFTGVLKVNCISGHKVEEKDFLSKSDPYLVCTVVRSKRPFPTWVRRLAAGFCWSQGDNGVPAVSRVIEDRANPKWNQTLMLRVPSLDTELKIACYDSDDVNDKRSPESRAGDDKIGEAAPQKVSDFADGETKALKLPLVSPDRRAAVPASC